MMSAFLLPFVRILRKKIASLRRDAMHYRNLYSGWSLLYIKQVFYYRSFLIGHFAAMSGLPRPAGLTTTI